MKSDPRYQVFISSTYEDLREERQQATQAILEMNHMPAGMELFPASDLSQWELIKTVINESDYYVVIVAARYGSVHPETGLSFTEMEYDYAVSINVPVLGFVRRDISEVKSKFTETDPVAKSKLENFRKKVMDKICRQFVNPAELGLHVMKSLMSETRVNPRIGWVRADQARGTEDLEREQAYIDEIKQKDAKIKKLERRIRDSSVKIPKVTHADLAQGDVKYEFSVSFQDKNKKHVTRMVGLTWDEIFSVIGPSMFGYVLRRGDPPYGKSTGSYKFEGSLIEYIRAKIISDVAKRNIDIMSHQIDAVLLHLKQLGYIAYEEIDEENGRPRFRGYTLTEFGEKYLTKINLLTGGG